MNSLVKSKSSRYSCFDTHKTHHISTSKVFLSSVIMCINYYMIHYINKLSLMKQIDKNKYISKYELG
jgi:hypothetical protein